MSLDERVPPNDQTAEAAVLSAVLLQAEALADIVPIVSPQHFYSDANRLIYEAQLALDEQGRPIDILTVKSWLEDRGLIQRIGGARYLAEILDAVPAVSNVDDYARRIKDKWRLRELINTCRRVAAEGYGAVDDIQKFVDAAEQSVFELSGERTDTGPERVDVIVKRSFADLQQRMTQEASARITTGFEGIDQVLVGLEAGKLVIVAARPGVGKTSLVDQWAWNVARAGAGVVLFTLEMLRDEQVNRILCQQARVNSRTMARTPEKLGPDDWRSLAEAARQLREIPLFIDDEPAITLPSLRAKTRRVASKLAREGKPLRVIAVDYLQLMEGTGRADNREQQVAANSRGLKRLAQDMGACVVCLSQLNRAVSSRGKKARPQLSDLRESGAIEQDADQVVFIHREDDDAVVAEVIVAKGRAYGAGTANLRWTKQYSRFDSLADDEAADDQAGGW